MNNYKKALIVASAVLCFNITAKAQKVTLRATNVTVKQAMNQLRQQTGYTFVFSSSDINTRKQVNVSANKTELSSVVEQILKGQGGLDYRIEGKNIIVNKAQHNSVRQIAPNASVQKGAGRRAAGQIVDENGEPMIGVTVTAKGLKGGTVTDIDGNFILDGIPAGVTTINVSYLGYDNKSVRITNGTMRISMRPNNKWLDEVVVVGYGSSKKRDLIASVSTVKAEEMSNVPITNIAQGLAGRSPGMIVTASGGGINSTPSISIRGGGTPLYVIDGVVRSATDFLYLSPDDIESMSILKDASATAIYGSRASNGIVQVVTKQGKSGKVNIDYDFNISFSQPSIWPGKLHSYERAKWGNIARENDGLEPVFSDEAIQKMRDGSDPLNYADTDWRKETLRDWAPQSKHTVRLSGGNDVNHFYISLGHINQNSLYRTDTNWMKRTNFRLSETTNLKNIGLQVGATIDGYRQETREPYTSGASGYWAVFSHINNRSPLLPARNKYGLPYNTSDNPVAETADDTGYRKNIENVINGKGDLVWSCLWVDGLKVRLSSNYRYYSTYSKNWRKDGAQYDWDSEMPQYPGKPQLSLQSGSGYQFTNQAFLEYANTFGKHNISALGGFEQTYGKSESHWGSRENYDFTIDQIEVGSASTMKNGGGESEAGRAAWIGQVKYNYANKYYAETNLRYDGSDYFAPGHRWGAFFSGALGWVVTEEKFMKTLVEKDILNSLKLRASYGETGLDSSAGRFAYLTSYSLNTQNYVVNGQFAPGFSEGSLPSPDLTWYTTRQTDIGFDFASLNNRLYGSFDYFYYSTKGYLTSPTGQSYLNTVIGIGMPKVKSDSEHRRAGWELQLGWRSNIGAFKYDISGNFTYFDQLWALNRDESESSYMNPYTRTQQQKGYYGTMLHNLGYYKSAEDVYNNPSFISSMNTGYLTAGDIKYEDTNGDGKIDGNDNRRLGKSSFPRGQFGINMNFQYKGFYLSMLFQGSTSFDMMLSGTATMQTGEAKQLPVIYDFQEDSWTPSNTNAKFPRLMSETRLNSNNNYAGSDFWLINGAYLRMKDFQFGYDLKTSLLRCVTWLTHAKVGISGQNIFTISNATKYGMDPETSSTTGYGYPVQRTLAFTVNLGF